MDGAMAQAGLRTAGAVFLFATYHHTDEVARMLDLAMHRAGTNAVVGCSGMGVLTDDREHDREPGDYLIRSLMGIDERSGALGGNEQVAVGQTIQFNRRTPDAAHEDMVQVMQRLQLRVGRRKGLCGLNFNCMGRGFGLYGQPDHDVLVIRKQPGAFPSDAL